MQQSVSNHMQHESYIQNTNVVTTISMSYIALLNHVTNNQVSSKALVLLCDKYHQRPKGIHLQYTTCSY